jgi:hypothetical protein
VQDTRINPAYVLNDRANQMQADINALQSRIELLGQQTQRPGNQFDQVAISQHIQSQVCFRITPQMTGHRTFILVHLLQFPNNFKAEWVHMLNLMKELEMHGGMKRVYHIMNHVEGHTIPTVESLNERVQPLVSNPNLYALINNAHNLVNYDASMMTNFMSARPLSAPEEETTEPEKTESPQAEEDAAPAEDSGEPSSAVAFTGRPREMTANMHELRSQFQQKHADLHAKLLDLTASSHNLNANIDTSQFVTSSHLSEVTKEIDTLKTILKQQQKGFVNRMELLNMLSLANAGTVSNGGATPGGAAAPGAEVVVKPVIPVDPLAAKLRLCILNVIQSIRSGNLTEEEADNILQCVSSYTDTPLKLQTSAMAAKLDEVSGYAMGMHGSVEKASSDVRDMKIRFAQFEDTMLMRYTIPITTK